MNENEMRQIIETRLREANAQLKAEYDSRVAAVRAHYENELTSLRAQVKNLTADVLAIQDMHDKHKLNMARGAGVMHGGVRLTAEDYREMLPAKIQAHSLGEIVTMQALAAGVDVRNEREFDAFLGIDKRER